MYPPKTYAIAECLYAQCRSLKKEHIYRFCYSMYPPQTTSRLQHYYSRTTIYAVCSSRITFTHICFMMSSMQTANAAWVGLFVRQFVAVYLPVKFNFSHLDGWCVLAVTYAFPKFAFPKPKLRYGFVTRQHLLWLISSATLLAPHTGRWSWLQNAFVTSLEHLLSRDECVTFTFIICQTSDVVKCALPGFLWICYCLVLFRSTWQNRRHTWSSEHAWFVVLNNYSMTSGKSCWWCTSGHVKNFCLTAVVHNICLNRILWTKDSLSVVSFA